MAYSIDPISVRSLASTIAWTFFVERFTLFVCVCACACVCVCVCVCLVPEIWDVREPFLEVARGVYQG